MTQWVYDVQEVSADNKRAIKERLDAAGAGGWELVNLWLSGRMINLVFKQQHQEELHSTPSLEETLKSSRKPAQR